ncbi:hypothetical protein G6K98_32290 [Agrobacterium rhizogenes]|nr:hypothetical protein [Rhizobium rhizogenes]NTH62195.1 hypothetical protein [Rhizobium rhizogenes]NTH93821.1 hypothetical protein [Rhizobium rhizogenes]
MSMPNNSPAVQSIRKEQKEQRNRVRRGDLDTGLQDSFPASDPVSATHSAVPIGRADTEAADRVKRQPNFDAFSEDLSLGDDALPSASEDIQSAQGSNYKKMPVIRQETSRTTDSTSEDLASPIHAPEMDARSVVRDIKAAIRARPLSAVAVAAAIAYVFGATR